MRHSRQPPRRLVERVRSRNLCASTITPGDVARIWKIFPRLKPGLVARAREMESDRRQAKLDAAELGLLLAYADIDDNPPPLRTWRAITPVDVVSRALYHATKIIAEHTERALPRGYENEARAEGKYQSGREANDLAECLAYAPQRLQELLGAISLSDGQRAVLLAFMEEGCSTLAEVDRASGWAHGTAAVQAARLREKARRAGLLSPNA